MFLISIQFFWFLSIIILYFSSALFFNFLHQHFISSILHFILGKGGRDSVGLIYLGICLKFCSRQMQNVFRVHRTSVTWLFNKMRFVKIVGDRSKSVPFSNFYFKTKSNLMILLWWKTKKTLVGFSFAITKAGGSLVFVWNSAMQERFNFYFSRDFC